MKNDYIALIDSGVGGFSVLKEMVKAFPNEKYIYYGDNSNAPYGEKSKGELLFIAKNIVGEIKKYRVKCLVLACNTLSTTILKEIEEYSKIKTFGVFPPVNIATSKNQSALLLATPNTCKNYCENSLFKILPQQNLAMQIEKNIFCLNNIDLSYLNIYKKQYNNVILGCTHYELIKNQIINHLQPLKIISGTQFTIKKVKKYLENQKSLGNIKKFSVLFLGKNANFNEEVWKKVVMNI